jgi:hypothetical protein
VRGLPCLAFLALLGWGSPSRADEAALPLDLEWSAPRPCATADEIRAELGRLARVKPGRSVTRLAAHARVEKLGQLYRLTLRTERNGQTGERSLMATECRSLEREVTLVLAVAFGEGVEIVRTDASAQSAQARGQHATGLEQARATPEAPAADARDASSRQAQVAPAPPSAASIEAPASKPGDARGVLFLGGGVVFGMLPSAAAMLVAGGELGWKSLWFAGRFVWLPGIEDTLPRGVQARYDGFGGALAACVRVAPQSWPISGCLGADATALGGRSTGASESGQAVAPLFGGVLGLAWEWPARGVVTLRLEAQLHVAFNEPRFVVDGLGEAHRVSRLAPSLAATVALWPGR